MTYNASIPQPGDFLSDSQAQILNNFTSLNTIFSRNHVPLTTLTNAGKHTIVEIVGGGNPATATVGIGVFYAKTSSSITDLFYKNDAENRQYQLTNVTSGSNAVADFAALGAATTGWTWMGQRIIMAYGSVAHARTSNQTISFPLTFASIPYSIQCTGIISSGSDPNQRASIGVRNGSVSTTQFIVETTSNAQLTGIYWVAVGRY